MISLPLIALFLLVILKRLEKGKYMLDLICLLHPEVPILLLCNYSLVIFFKFIQT